MSMATLWNKWRQRGDAAAAARAQNAHLADAIERMVQNSDPGIRSVRGYRQQLRLPVANSLAYIERLVALVPGPVDLAPDRWDKSGLARALFTDPVEAAGLIQDSSELKAFFSARSQAREAVAILTATREERTIFATAQEGDIVRRDVPQVSVEFRDLRIVAPAATEAEARRELEARTLQLLAAGSLRHMLERRSLREELAEQRRILEIKLKILRTRADALECTLASDCDPPEPAEPGADLLADIDRQLAALAPESMSADAHLEYLAEVLNHPAEVMEARAFSLNLNWMGVKSQEPTPGSAPITLAELEIKGRLKRVAVLVRVPRAGCFTP